MNSVIFYLQQRFTWLNGIRLLLAITFLGEAISSRNYWMLAITLVFLVQISQNKICGPQGCEIQKK